MGAPLRHCLLVAAALSLGCGVAAADPGYVANVIPCEQRTLVLSAFPAEADAVLAHTALDANPVVLVAFTRPMPVIATITFLPP